MSRIRDDVERLAESGDSVAKLVVAFGDEQAARPRPAGIELGRRNACFETSGRLVFEHSDLAYVEGFALYPISDKDHRPTHHAWLSDGTSAIEVTWPRPASAYFGVRMDIITYFRLVKRYGVDGVLWELAHEMFPAT